MEVQHTVTMHRSQLDCPSFVDAAVSKPLQPLSRAVYNDLVHGKLTYTPAVTDSGAPARVVIRGGLIPLATLLRAVAYRMVDAVLTAICQSHADLLQPELLPSILYQCAAVFVAPSNDRSSEHNDLRFPGGVGPAIRKVIEGVFLLSPVTELTQRVTLGSIDLSGYSAVCTQIRDEIVTNLGNMSTRDHLRGALSSVVLESSAGFHVSSKSHLRLLCDATSTARAKYVAAYGESPAGVQLLQLLNLFCALKSGRDHGGGDGGDGGGSADSETASGGAGKAGHGDGDSDVTFGSSTHAAICHATRLRFLLNGLFLGQRGGTVGRRCALAPSARLRAWPLTLYQEITDRLATRWHEKMTAVALAMLQQDLQLPTCMEVSAFALQFPQLELPRDARASDVFASRRSSVLAALGGSGKDDGTQAGAASAEPEFGEASPGGTTTAAAATTTTTAAVEEAVTLVKASRQACLSAIRREHDTVAVYRCVQAEVNAAGAGAGPHRATTAEEFRTRYASALDSDCSTAAKDGAGFLSADEKYALYQKAWDAMVKHYAWSRMDWGGPTEAARIVRNKREEEAARWCTRMAVATSTITICGLLTR